MPALPQVGQVVNGYAYSGGNPADPTAWKPLTGDDFLKTLNPVDQTQVKALAEGRMSFPGGMSMKAPYWTQRLEQVGQYDPSFNSSDFNSRAATRKDFTSGKSAQNITSFNTVLQHLGKLQEATDALHNHDVTALNAVGNFFEPMIGDPRVNNFNTIKQAAISELTRAFRGAGGSEGDIVAWGKTLDPNMSPAQLQGAIRNGVELLKGRIDAMGDQYNRGMGRAQDPITLLSPGARDTFKKLATLGEPNAPQAQAQAEGQAPGPSAPAGGGTVARIQSDADYASLPSGTLFVGPDGHTRKKP